MKTAASYSASPTTSKFPREACIELNTLSPTAAKDKHGSMAALAGGEPRAARPSLLSPLLTKLRGLAGMTAMGNIFDDWQSLIVPVIEKLRSMATTSENDFLRIGEQMQAVYQNSLEIAELANQLVEAVSGQNLQALSSRLRQVAAAMESFLATFQARSSKSISTLHQVRELLGQLDSPMKGVQKMARAFYTLEVSIRIESARLGELGNGFITLSLDIKNLSQQVNEKLNAIREHRDSVNTIIAQNLSGIKQLSTTEEEDAQRTIQSTIVSLQDLDAANVRFSQLGVTIAGTVQEITTSIGEVVSSMQFHDINRQQLEHIIEALDRLTTDIASFQNQGLNAAARHALIVEAGDTCELQEAQLHFASSELYTAVSTIITSLRDVASQQSTIELATTAAAGVMDESGTSSFIDTISQGMATTTNLLHACAGSHHSLSSTMDEMAAAIGASTSFVKEIDGIGYIIVKTALNAQIAAAKTGVQGAGLTTLSEEIRRLADDASVNTAAIATQLSSINQVTAKLISESGSDETSLSAWLATVDADVNETMTMLGDMKNQFSTLVATIQDKIGTLAADVSKVTASIDVHERSKGVAAEVMSALSLVVTQSRARVPASREFMESLQKMNENYTMASERLVHQGIASRHGVTLELAATNQLPANSGDESGFGDNVDLF